MTWEHISSQLIIFAISTELFSIQKQGHLHNLGWSRPFLQDGFGNGVLIYMLIHVGICRLVLWDIQLSKENKVITTSRKNLDIDEFCKGNGREHIPLASTGRNSFTAPNTKNWAMVLYVLSGLGGALLSTFANDWWGSLEMEIGMKSGRKSAPES